MHRREDRKRYEKRNKHVQKLSFSRPQNRKIRHANSAALAASLLRRQILIITIKPLQKKKFTIQQFKQKNNSQ